MERLFSENFKREQLDVRNDHVENELQCEMCKRFITVTGTLNRELAEDGYKIVNK